MTNFFLIISKIKNKLRTVWDSKGLKYNNNWALENFPSSYKKKSAYARDQSTHAYNFPEVMFPHFKLGSS